ncbi:MAG TPA: PGPGW domain-containing protein [Thermoanaerobaculia bacterium]|nr:PGPGW domain-containing protein [Thermoanaerobaculia bacterium]
MSAPPQKRETLLDDEPLSPAERAGLPMRIDLEPHRRPLPFWVRVAIFVIGWVLILIGVAGLVLPGIQGIATILVGAALLSIDNELIYRGLRRSCRRWPKLWHKIERFRAKAHDKIHRLVHRRR